MGALKYLHGLSYIHVPNLPLSHSDGFLHVIWRTGCSDSGISFSPY